MNNVHWTCITYQTLLPYYDHRQMRFTLPKQIFSWVQDKPFGHTFWATLEDICCLWHHAACNVYAQRYIGHHSEFHGSFGVEMLAKMLRQKVFLSFLFFQISSTYGELIFDTEYQQHPHNQLLKVGVPHQLRTLRPPSAPSDRLSSPRSHRRSSTPPSTPCRTLRSWPSNSKRWRASLEAAVLMVWRYLRQPQSWHSSQLHKEVFGEPILGISSKVWWLACWGF